MPALLAGGAIFVSAFLLFQLQPMVAKAILPWFGGSAAVWGTCLVFFQAVLFLGYLYAHWLTQKVAPKWQWRVHGLLLLASMAMLPVLPSAAWKPTGDEDPSVRILLLLTATVGLPYFLLSSTSPLLQAWYSRTRAGALPYRYFALSNFASLAALLGYPTITEPWSTLKQQSWGWSAGYLFYAAGCVVAGWLASRYLQPLATPTEKPLVEEGPRPSFRDRALWVLLAAFASVLSLAVTNHLTQNVAAIPFLWVLPLAAYLLTFILCFERDGWYPRKTMLTLHGCALAGLAYLVLIQTPSTSIRLVIPALVGGLFLCCMFCHGELARRKPGSAHLTQFYLMIALGGAIGAILVGLGAPYLLLGSYELPLALAACALFTLLLEYKKWWVTDLVWASVAVGVFVSAGTEIRAYKNHSVLLTRNFYGGLRVVDSDDARQLVHGIVVHGTQYKSPEKRRRATAYYAPGSGVERAIEAFRRPGERVGVIGLGAGTLAAYGKPGDFYCFYEINPQVIEVARTQFTYLGDSQAHIEVVAGDGRLALERQAPQNFDVLAVDAFSGDSVPVHLLSLEAMQLYFTHIRPGGVLAFHVSNTALALAPVVERLADVLGYVARDLHVTADAASSRAESEWVLVARDELTLDRPQFENSTRPIVEIAGLRAWTDDYSALYRILK